MRTHFSGDMKCNGGGALGRAGGGVAPGGHRSIGVLTSVDGRAPLARPALLNKPPDGEARKASRRGHSTAARGGPAHRSRLAAARHGRHAGSLASHARGARHHRGRHDAPATRGAARARGHEVCPAPVPRALHPPTTVLCRYASNSCTICESVVSAGSIIIDQNKENDKFSV